MTNVLSKYKPNSIYEFTKGFLETYPEDAATMQEILEKSIKDPTGRVRNALLKIVSVVTASKAYEKTKEFAGNTREVFEEIGRTISETDIYKATSAKTSEVAGEARDSLATFGKSITNTDAYKTVASKSKILAGDAKKSMIKTKNTVSKKSNYRSFLQKAKNFLSKIFKGNPEQEPPTPKMPLTPPEAGISKNKSDSF